MGERGDTDERGGTDEWGIMNEGVTNEARKRRGNVLDGEQQIFKRRLRLAPRWAPSCARVPMSNSTIPKSSPALVGNLSTRYLHTGDLFVQVFPQMNPQVPVKVLVLVLSPTSAKPKPEFWRITTPTI